jgi:NAD(P)-dependent dehydrogenase (short-subunit alcohol dehydrogenase family)
MESNRVWLVTGCSSGLGRALAQRVLERGQRCVVTARDSSRIGGLVAPYAETSLALALDVRDAAQRKRALAQTLERFRALDVLVNNAGHGYSAAVEEGDEAVVRTMFDTNFFGLAAMIREALPIMRKQRGGHIVNISSIGGIVANAASGYYNASKFAVEGLSIALAQEVAPLGIRVTLIEPGPFRTDFQGRSMTPPAQTIDDYASTAAHRRAQLLASSGRQQGDPVRAADAIIDLVDHPDPPLHLVLGKVAVGRARAKLTAQLRSIDEWEAVSVGTEYPEP